MLTQSQDIYGRWKLKVIKEFYFGSQKSWTQCRIYDSQVCILLEDKFLGSSFPPLLKFASTYKLERNTIDAYAFRTQPFPLQKRGRERRSSEACRFWKHRSSAKGGGAWEKGLPRLSSGTDPTGHSFSSSWGCPAFFLHLLGLLPSCP